MNSAEGLKIIFQHSEDTRLGRKELVGIMDDVDAIVGLHVLQMKTLKDMARCVLMDR